MNFQRFTGPGSMPIRRALWDKVFSAVIAARKTEGKNTSVTEYEGQGTLVAFKRDRGGALPGVCPDVSADVTVEISGYTSCGCVEVGPSSVILDVTNANGTWVLPNYDSTNWVLFDAFTVTAYTYPGVSDCSGDPVESEIDITVQFQCDSDMLIIENWSPFGPPFLFAAGGCPIENGATCPYTLGDCDGSTIYGSGGEAVVSW